MNALWEILKEWNTVALVQLYKRIGDELRRRGEYAEQGKDHAS
jgi:hypothetical protein